MTKAEIIRLLIGFLIGHVLGYFFAYIHNAIYDEKILAAVSEQLDIIQRANAEEVKGYHKEINDLNKIIARYREEHEKCPNRNGNFPYRNGNFHCVSPEPLKRSKIDWKELDFPNNKEDKT